MITLIIFQLVCLVQAFRGRNLPGPMNSAMSLLYTTLITTVAFAIGFPIGYFRETADKEFMYFTLVSFNCFVVLLFLYCKQCYFIRFKPSKNTKNYFAQKRMSKMSTQFSSVSLSD